MENLLDHTVGHGSQLYLHRLVHAAQSERLEVGPLPLGRAVLALDLSNFNFCHCLASLSFKYSLHGNTADTCHSIGIAELCEGSDGGFNQVVRVGRALGLSQHVLNAY